MERLRSECIYCILEKQVRQIPEGTPDSIKIDFLQKIFRVFATAPKDEGAPKLVRDINWIKKEMFHIENEYGEVKRHFNEVMMAYEKRIGQVIHQSEDPLKTALQYAMVGNYIDFGAMKNVDEKQLDELMCHADRYALDDREYSALKRDLENGGKLVLITDNCGEIVMDKLLLTALREQYPDVDISVIVRGKPVLNDATMEDAVQVGMTEQFRVLDSGTGIAGICEEELPDETLRAYREADIILSKGQGNFESMRYCGRNIYYLFLCKCDLFANQFGVKKLTGILVNDRNLS